LRSLTRLVLDGTAVSSGLKHLTSLKELRKLSICDCADVSDEDIQQLSTLAKLEALYASSTGIKGKTLAALKVLSNLGRLDVNYTTISATAAITALAQLTQLRQLAATAHSNSTPAPAALAKLSRLTQLQEISLFGHCLSGAALALLDLPQLTFLGAKGIQAPSSRDHKAVGIKTLTLEAPSSTELAALLPLPDLRTLSIDVSPDITHTQQQGELTHLALGGLTSRHSATLTQVLRALSNLQRLELWAPCLDQACLLAIAGLKHLQTLWLEATRMPGELLSVLNHCPKLHSVTLQCCRNVGRAGLLALLCKPGMQEVVVRQVQGLEECLAGVQEVATQLEVSLELHDTQEDIFYGQPDSDSSESGSDSDGSSGSESDEEQDA
jgi:hypothetical protein